MIIQSYNDILREIEGLEIWGKDSKTSGKLPVLMVCEGLQYQYKNKLNKNGVLK